MPTTATFKSKLYAHANRAARPQRTFPGSAATTRGDVTKVLELPERRDADDAGPAPGSTGRSLNDLPDRGSLLDPKAVAMMLFPGMSRRELPGKMKWVRENVPFKVPLGHKTVGWFEADVRWWLEDRRNGNFDSVRRRAAQTPKAGANDREAPAKTRRRVLRKRQNPSAKKTRTAR